MHRIKSHNRETHCNFTVKISISSAGYHDRVWKMIIAFPKPLAFFFFFILILRRLGPREILKGEAKSRQRPLSEGVHASVGG